MDIWNHSPILLKDYFINSIESLNTPVKYTGSDDILLSDTPYDVYDIGKFVIILEDYKEKAFNKDNFEMYCDFSNEMNLDQSQILKYFIRIGKNGQNMLNKIESIKNGFLYFKEGYEVYPNGFLNIFDTEVVNKKEPIKRGDKVLLSLKELNHLRLHNSKNIFQDKYSINGLATNAENITLGKSYISATFIKLSYIDGENFYDFKLVNGQTIQLHEPIFVLEKEKVSKNSLKVGDEVLYYYNKKQGVVTKIIETTSKNYYVVNFEDGNRTLSRSGVKLIKNNE